MAKKIFLLVDGHALIYRAYHAFPTIFVNADGQLTNAVYGFARILLAAIREFHPEYIAIAFDSKEKTKRQAEFAFYKSTRPPMPDDLIGQIEIIKELVRALNIPQFAIPTIEADDIIGTMARKLANVGVKNKKGKNEKIASDEDDENQGCNKREKLDKDNINNKSCSDKQGEPNVVGGLGEILTIILTGDKDTLQLAGDSTHIYLPARGKKQTAEELDAEGVKKKMGVCPEQIIDYKALAGDQSDDIPGVMGVGAKTAVNLLLEFGNLDGIYQAIDEEKLTAEDKSVKHPILKGALLEKLIRDRKQAYISQKLATIDCYENVDFDLESCRVKNYDKQTAIKILEEMDFPSLIKMLPQDQFDSDLQEALF